MQTGIIDEGVREEVVLLPASVISCICLITLPYGVGWALHTVRPILQSYVLCSPFAVVVSIVIFVAPRVGLYRFLSKF